MFKVGAHTDARNNFFCFLFCFKVQRRIGSLLAPRTRGGVRRANSGAQGRSFPVAVAPQPNSLFGVSGLRVGHRISRTGRYVRSEAPE